MTAFKALQEQNRYIRAGVSPAEMTTDTSEHVSWSFFSFCSHDAMDSFYDYIWDITILEYLTRILSLLIHEATLTFNCHVNV